MKKKNKKGRKGWPLKSMQATNLPILKQTKKWRRELN